jgi:outer membrane immunogenic protein
MRNLLLATLAVLTLPGSAFAADLATAKPAQVSAPPQAVSWTGLYIGADIGGDFGTTNLNWSGTDWSTRNLNSSGVLGGGYIGYNYQLNQTLVIGVEGDFQGTNNTSSFSWAAGKASPFKGDLFTLQNDGDWVAAANGRLAVSYDRALFYAIGGFAWRGGNSSLTGTNATATAVISASQTTNRSGFDIGGGAEYALTPNWVGRVEYRYYDFGGYYLGPSVANFAPIHEQTSVNAVRIGLSYLFNAPIPIVGK